MEISSILFRAIQDMAFTVLDDLVLSCLNKLHYKLHYVYVYGMFQILREKFPHDFVSGES